MPVGADVARDLADLLVGDVEAVVAAKREEEVVAGDAGDGLRLEAEQLSDTVVLVDDVVARAQIGEALERAPDPCVGARWTLAEDLRVREQDQIEVAKDEAAARRRHREEEPRLVREVVARVENDRVQSPQHGLRPLGLPAVRERDDDPAAALHVGEKVSLGLRQAPGRHGRALRLEAVALAGRELGQAERASEVHGGAELLADDLLHLVRLPDEVGLRQRRHEVVRQRRRLPFLREHRLDQVEAPLGRRVDRRRLERVQGPLRERGEGAQGLDLVAEQLEANRLAAGRGEDVEDSAADRELTALLGLRHPLVAGESKSLGERLRAGLVPDAQHDRLRPRPGRGDLLREAERRRADEPALRQDLERAGALTDEVRRRLETAAPANAARGEEPDVVLAEEPAGAFGRVPGLGIVRQDDDQRARARAMEAGEEERQERLRDARLGRVVQELAQALALGEVAGDRAERGLLQTGRSVHDERRNSRFRGVIVAACRRPPRRAQSGVRATPSVVLRTGRSSKVGLPMCRKKG